MPSNVAQFKADLGGLSAKLGISGETVFRRITLDAWRRITKRTPVDTGRARASWMLTIAEPSSEVLPAGDYDKTKGIPAPDPALALQAKLGQVVYITSNVPYIEHLENGTSTQAPAGMVRISLAEIEAELDRILGKI